MCLLEFLCLIHDASLFVIKSTLTMSGVSSVRVLAVLGKTFKSLVTEWTNFISD